MPKTAVIADDEISMRFFLRSIIQQFVPASKVEEVTDGQSLVERVRLGGLSLIILDYQMGSGMTGIEAIEAIRAFDQRTPIYMCSASKKRDEAMAAGATDYIRKPDEAATKVMKAAEKHLQL